MVRAAILLLLLAGCASSPRDPALDAYPDTSRLSEERARETGRRLQDEFNALAGES